MWKKEFCMKRLKKVIRKFAGQIPKNWKIYEKMGHFSDGMWMSTAEGCQAHVDECGQGEGGQNPIFVWTS